MQNFGQSGFGVSTGRPIRANRNRGALPYDIKDVVVYAI